MLGFSVYLGKPFNNDYIQNMLNLGFELFLRLSKFRKNKIIILDFLSFKLI